jgi:adenine-specific DNA-methyltransferase
VKGFVPTPSETVDLMVDRLFLNRRPASNALVLDPGCGHGVFIDGIIRWCAKHRAGVPRIVGIESNPKHAEIARARFGKCASVEIRDSDFLTDKQTGTYDFIVGNPPYVPITELSEREKQHLRERFETATGRFDLYLLFFEQAMKLLKPDGRLVFITPEKFLYVETAQALRKILARKNVEEVRLINEATFAELVTYPTITTVSNEASRPSSTLAILRNGSEVRIVPPMDGSSWLPSIMGHNDNSPGLTLQEVCVRISCGVATGADEVFVKDADVLPANLRRFAYPSIAGREMGDFNDALDSRKLILVPYELDGTLISEGKLGKLKDYLSQPAIRSQLIQRTCVRRKPWYAFHETPPLNDILRPKILCKDITERPRFWIDQKGKLIPRHSVYYIVPRDSAVIEDVCDYLNSKFVAEWLTSHCQRVANGFLRLQSHVLKRLPIPAKLSTLRKTTQSHQLRSSVRSRGDDTRTRQLEFGR